MTDEIAALHARIASMQAEIWSLRATNAYPASVRWHAREEERERCAKLAEDCGDKIMAAAIRALGDE
jgi:hypothetical protein